MSATATPEQEATFERRYYEAMRRHRLAPEIGRVALDGLERRRYEEITSGLAEALPGVISTEYPFSLKEGKLVASDGQSIEDLLKTGRETAYKMADTDDFYKNFLPQRAEHEIDEFYEQEAMANGEVGHNTMVTFSPYSEEFDSAETQAKITKAGQKPYWKRAMLRVSHWDGQQLHIFTRSIDNSSVELLKKVAKQNLDYDFKAADSTQMLGERITLDINDESWKGLSDSIVNTADEILTKRMGGKRKQGRTQQQSQDLQTFVESQTQIVDYLISKGKQMSAQYDDYESYQEAFEDVMYDQIALLEKRLESGETGHIENIAEASGGAGAEARSEGRSYDMCGSVIGGKTTVAAQAAAKVGYETAKLSAKKEFDSKWCPNCLPKPQPGKKVKAWRKNEHIGCGDCGHVIDVCTNEVIKQGRKTFDNLENTDEDKGLFGILSADRARIRRQLMLEEEKKHQKVEAAKRQQKLSF